MGEALYQRPRDGATRRLAERGAGVSWESLTEEVRRQAEVVVADTLACGIGARAVSPETVRMVQAYSAGVGSVGKSVVLATGERAGASVAAWANGALCHALDFDDAHIPSIAHFGAPCVAAALGLLQQRGGSGRDLLTAVVAGFGVGGALGRAVMPGHYRFWHGTSSLGGVAAAASAARALGLSAEATDMAISLAADGASGTRYCITAGDASKVVHAGGAAERGVVAALLAESGIDGPSGLLEHEIGFMWAYSEEHSADRLLRVVEAVGERWEILEDDIKPYPSVRISHAPVRAMAELMADGARLEDVASVTVVQPPSVVEQGWNTAPETLAAARMSIPYCIAALLVDGSLTLRQFDDTHLFDPAVREVMGRVRGRRDPALLERYGTKTCATVELRLRSGEVVERTVVWPPGSPRSPLPPEEHEAKVRSLLELGLGSDAEEDAWRVVSSISGVEDLDDGLAVLWRAATSAKERS